MSIRMPLEIERLAMPGSSRHKIFLNLVP
jgi:hypothetical protein